MKVKGPLVLCPPMNRLAFDRSGKKPEADTGINGQNQGDGDMGNLWSEGSHSLKAV